MAIHHTLKAYRGSRGKDPVVSFIRFEGLKVFAVTIIRFRELSAPKMEAASSTEMFLKIYRTALSLIPEDSSSHSFLITTLEGIK
jgi:hypothetical protein